MIVEIKQSVNKNGLYKWYWFIILTGGHIYHISPGFLNFNDCVDNLKRDCHIIGGISDDC